jgi:thiol-disulfide isomerase/thioredoxin
MAHCGRKKLAADKNKSPSMDAPLKTRTISARRIFKQEKLYFPHSLMSAGGLMEDDKKDILITKEEPGLPAPVAKENTPPGLQQIPELLIEVDDVTWERSVEKSGKPVAVMFYSPDCVFCHQMEPYFRNFAEEYRKEVIFARLNIMTNQWTAERYGVRSTPTFKFFCDGKPVREMVGAIYPTLLKKMVDEVLIHGKECAKNSTAINYEITGYG